MRTHGNNGKDEQTWKYQRSIDKRRVTIKERPTKSLGDLTRIEANRSVILYTVFELSNIYVLEAGCFPYLVVATKCYFKIGWRSFRSN